MDAAPDGSPVAIYQALPATPEFDAVIEALAPGASVLDLGCGPGRLSNLLVARGYEAVGVDESAAMLAHLDERVEAVRTRIEQLELDRTFDAVVLASNLINTPDLAQRDALLAAVRRHLDHAGRAFIERYDPHWAATVTTHDGRTGEVAMHFEIISRHGLLFEARVTYRLDGTVSSQQFRARIVDDEEMSRALLHADLELERWLTSRWAVARTPPAGHSSPRSHHRLAKARART